MLRKSIFWVLITLLFITCFAYSQVRQPRWDCCANIWGVGCNLGWATALFNNTQIRERWDPNDQIMVDLLNRAAQGVIACGESCSEPIWDDYQGKSNWLRGLINTFTSRPDSTTRNRIFSQVNGTYGWGNQLARQVYHYRNQRHETHFETCGEKYYKLGFSISAAIQHLRHADEALRFNNQQSFKDNTQMTQRWLRITLGVLNEYNTIVTGQCVPLDTAAIYNELYPITTQTIRPENVQYLIGVIDRNWRTISDALFNSCPTGVRPPGPDPDPDDQPEVDVRDATQSNFVGRYNLSDPNRSHSKYNGTATFNADGSFTSVEYLSGSRQDGKGTWSFSNGVFTIDWQPGGKFSGSTRGSNRDFSIQGNWANGSSGTLRLSK